MIVQISIRDDNEFSVFELAIKYLILKILTCFPISTPFVYIYYTYFNLSTLYIYNSEFIKYKSFMCFTK